MLDLRTEPQTDSDLVFNHPAERRMNIMENVEHLQQNIRMEGSPFTHQTKSTGLGSD